MPSVLSKPLNLWDKTGTDIFLNKKISHEFSVNQGENGDYHWWVETPDKKIIDNTPRPEPDEVDRIFNNMTGIDYDRPVYFEWTDPELVSKMEKIRKKHLSEFAELNKIPPEELPFALDALYIVREFQALSCDINASATQKNIDGSRLCVGTLGHRCKGGNKGTICVAYGM